MLCQKCGAELQDNAAFCMECGAKVERKVICRKCGSELQENAVFCMECGTKVNTAEEPVVDNISKNPEAEYFGDDYVKVTEKYWINPFYKLIRNDLQKYTATELFAIMYQKATGSFHFRGYLGVKETKEFYEQLRLAKSISEPLRQFSDDEDIAFLYISTDKANIAEDVFMITDKSIYSRKNRYLIKDVHSLQAEIKFGYLYFSINGKPIAKSYIGEKGIDLFNNIAEVYLLLVNKRTPISKQKSENRLASYIKDKENIQCIIEKRQYDLDHIDDDIWFETKTNQINPPKKEETKVVQQQFIPPDEVEQSVTYNNINSNIPRKSRILTALLAIFLGGLGAHKFYLGKTKWGIIYLLFCWTWIPLIMGVLSGVKYLLMSDRQFEDKFFVRVN